MRLISERFDFLRNGDYVFSYFIAPGGVTMWTMKRGEEFYLSCLMNGRHTYHHMPFDPIVNMTTVATLSVIGFQEIPIDLEYNGITCKTQDMTDLLAQFDIARAIARDIQKDAEDLAKLEKAAAANAVEAETTEPADQPVS